MIDGFKGEHLLADRAYATQEILDKAKSQDMKMVLFHQRKIANNKENMMSIYTKLGICLRMHSCILSVGAVLQHAMQRIPVHSLLLCKLDA